MGVIFTGCSAPQSATGSPSAAAVEELTFIRHGHTRNHARGHTDAHTGQNERERIQLYHKEEIQHRPAHIGADASPLSGTNQHRYQQFKN